MMPSCVQNFLSCFLLLLIVSGFVFLRDCLCTSPPGKRRFNQDFVCNDDTEAKICKNLKKIFFAKIGNIKSVTERPGTKWKGMGNEFQTSAHQSSSVFSSDQIKSEASTSFEILVKLQRGREREIHRKTFKNPRSNFHKSMLQLGHSTYEFRWIWTKFKTRKQSDLGRIIFFIKSLNVIFEPQIGQKSFVQGWLPLRLSGKISDFFSVVGVSTFYVLFKAFALYIN